MTTIQMGILLLFGIVMVLVITEHFHGVAKSPVVLIGGVVIWTLSRVALAPDERSHFLMEMESEIFRLTAFLMYAMALVAIMNMHGMFHLIKKAIYSLQWDDRREFLAVCLLTFFASAVLDNLTITLVMLSISPYFFRTEKNQQVTAAAVVINANAGGAWSPIGDVTTIMLWVQGKITAQEVLTQGFLPAAAMGIVASGMLYFQIQNTTENVVEDMDVIVSLGEKLILLLCGVSFALPLIVSLTGEQPYMGLMLGLGGVWAVCGIQDRMQVQLNVATSNGNGTSLAHHPDHEGESHQQTRLERNLEHVFREIEMPTIMFLFGILLAVGGLQASGVLEHLSHALLGTDPSFQRVAGTNVLLGLLSALVDNVPLTALAIKTMTVTHGKLWVLLALTVGTGGSVLSVGSVPGVVAMGKVKGLTFFTYLRIASAPALAGYAAMVAVWYLQTLVSGV